MPHAAIYFPACRRKVLPEVGQVGSADVFDEDRLVAVGRALRPDSAVGAHGEVEAGLDGADPHFADGHRDELQDGVRVERVANT